LGNRREEGSGETYPVEVGIVPEERSKDDEIWCSRETGGEHLGAPCLIHSFRKDGGLGLAWEPEVEILERRLTALASARGERVRRRRRRLTGWLSIIPKLRSDASRQIQHRVNSVSVPRG